ncbi:GDP-mannose-dependent alpha-mannosyltransferase [Acaryochloris thomasi RCC1774]|uniref:GDP-mannose-dependent alpha-mannosyltransferase n=1 Tax=Acaryochloris thomasi RCC1774 TaxID=1764569 RepID=A0A2W1JWY0_9CYAN|nr:glycosyltransferase [Acaryochloris thomasi]PZD73191.1 GDP-mannose-dependent alpha-mannosyltransferase [Acaryochloris thomasi RCC1774]
MKIALISSGFLPVVDGVSVAIANRLQQLSRQGHSVLLLVPDYAALGQTYPDWQTHVGSILPNVKVVPLESNPALGLAFERDVKPKAYRTVLAELGAFAPDIIHVDEPERLSFCLLKKPGIAYARQHNIPCVGFFHTHYIDYIDDYVTCPKIFTAGIQALFKVLFAWIYNSYDATLVASPTTYQAVCRMGIRNAVQDDFLGFDAPSFWAVQRQPHFFEQTYGLKNLENTVRLVFVGRLTPDKGWGFTCHAARQLIKAVNPADVSLIIVGDGPLRESLEQDLGSLFTHVHLLGRIPPQQMPALLANSDIHVTASAKETTGLTVLEASASGIPILAPRAGGVVDYIYDGQTGFLFNPQDPEDFVQKLRFLIENMTVRQAMGAAGKDHVIPYSWEQAVERLLIFWQTKISERTREKFQTTLHSPPQPPESGGS